MCVKLVPSGENSDSVPRSVSRNSTSRRRPRSISSSICSTGRPVKRVESSVTSCSSPLRSSVATARAVYRPRSPAARYLVRRSRHVGTIQPPAILHRLGSRGLSPPHDCPERPHGSSHSRLAPCLRNTCSMMSQADGSTVNPVDGQRDAPGQETLYIACESDSGVRVRVVRLQVADETFDVGVDTRTSVNEKDYQVPFAFNGKIDKLTVNLGPTQLTSEEHQMMQRALARARD